eukprot:TRINITY_DN30398_c0_g2_i1.p1 TRINITY_DN30398_c0_g2~~TRINITY_DN30398_c0_g2_i1.p1  ORF type:complete len:612 (-),score=99.17 TRINITY_DN30398_c0_g2_i1:109-1872(-)
MASSASVHPPPLPNHAISDPVLAPSPSSESSGPGPMGRLASRLMPVSSPNLGRPFSASSGHASGNRVGQAVTGASRMLMAQLLDGTERAEERSETESGDDIESSGAARRRRSTAPSKGFYTFVNAGRKFFRVLDRDYPFGQSGGKWSIQNITCSRRHHQGPNGSSPLSSASEAEEARKHALLGDTGQMLNKLLMGDMYHTFLDAKFSMQLGTLAGAYVTSFVIFAFLFLLISEPCGLNLEGSFIRAYMLALETILTIGYGVPDPYMKGCWQGPLVMTMQSLVSLLMSAVLVGVIYQRLARPQSRACTILFSDKAVIRRMDGVYYFMFRVCDMRIKHALIETHVRCYCVRKHSIRGYEMSPMRLEQPDDELGGMLLLTLPTVVVHRIDAWSPLSSRQTGTTSRRRASFSSREVSDVVERKREQIYLRTATWPGTAQRQVDCETGNRDSCVCPTCGETFGTATMLQLHCRYNAESDRLSGFSEEARHKELTEEDLATMTHDHPTREEIEQYLDQGYVEVIVLVEGIDPSTSCTLQARHSYIVGGPEGGDVAWDMGFTDCCRTTKNGSGKLEIDLARFHKVEPRRMDTDI